MLKKYWIFIQISFLFENTILPVNNGKQLHSSGYLSWPCSSLHDRSQYRLCAAVFHQWLQEYCPLNPQLFLAHNIECSFGYVAGSAVLLKLNVANILLFNFCEQKFFQHDSITIAFDCHDHSISLVEKWSNYATGPKSANSATRFACVGFSVYATILLVYIPAKIGMSFIWKDDFFLPKSASSVSRSQAHLAKWKRIGWSAKNSESK